MYSVQYVQWYEYVIFQNKRVKTMTLRKEQQRK